MSLFAIVEWCSFGWGAFFGALVGTVLGAIGATVICQKTHHAGERQRSKAIVENDGRVRKIRVA